jgi:DNA-binding response OmpR family regulator
LILLVDKDPISADSIAYYLESAGYEVEALYDPQVALGEIAQVQPELIVVEVILSGMSGLSLCEAVRTDAATAHVPIILVSVLAPGDRGRACSDCYLLKPVDREALVSAVVRIFNEGKG